MVSSRGALAFLGVGVKAACVAGWRAAHQLIIRKLAFVEEQDCGLTETVHPLPIIPVDTFTQARKAVAQPLRLVFVGRLGQALREPKHVQSHGKAIVRLRGVDDPQKLRFTLRGLAGQPSPYYEYEDGALRTRQLVPGGYELRVRGGGLAASRTEFTIVEGKQIEAELELRPGIRVPIEVTVPSESPIPLLRLVIQSGGECLLDIRIPRTEGRIYRYPIHLGPGDYAVSGTAEGFAGTMPLTVKTGSDNPTAKMTLSPK